MVPTVRIVALAKARLQQENENLMRINWRMMVALTAVLAILGAACGGDAGSEAEATDGPAGAAPEATEPASTEMTESGTAESTESGAGDVSGTIEIDGSSTVAPLTQAIVEEYPAEGVTVNVGVSGTGGGFERFCGTGDTDISNASRPIQEEEIQLCDENGIEYTEIRVGTDALTMVTNPASEGIDCMTQEDIIEVFGPDRVQTWSEVDPSFPDEQITIFAPDTDSGTYDFMVEDIMGLEESTQDYQPSADDNVIVQGIAGTPYSWGFFGFAFYQENADQLKAIAYDAGEGCVEASVEAAQNDEYALTRPLFIYVKNSAFTEKPQVQDFVNFYLETTNDVIESVGYVPLPEDRLAEAQETVANIGS